MKFKDKDIKSSIKKDEILGLYKLILPGIKRYFEGIIFCTNTKKVYGNFDKIDIEENIFLDNKVFCLSSFFNHKIACFIDLDSMQSNYFFFIDSKLFNFEIEGKKYFCFSYIDYKGKLLFYSDYKGQDFILKIKNKKIILENNIFGTEVFSKDISNLSGLLKNKVNLVKKDIKYIDVADFYIFDDYFTKIEGYEDFYAFLTTFSNENIEINKNLHIRLQIHEYKDIFLPKFRINLSIFSENMSEIDLSEFRKILLFFTSENILSYIIDNPKINIYFSKYIKDISKNKILELDLNYTIPTDIYTYDSKFSEFKLNILLLRYNYFKLKENIDKMSKLDIINNSIYSNFSQIRGEKIEENMKTTLILYENKLKSILTLIKR